MTLAAEFHEQPSGRIEVRVGVHVVGTIYAPAAGTVRFTLTLPDASGPRLVDSVGKARRVILIALADWFDACGPEFGSIASALAAQSDSERAPA